MNCTSWPRIISWHCPYPMFHLLQPPTVFPQPICSNSSEALSCQEKYWSGRWYLQKSPFFSPRPWTLEEIIFLRLCKLCKNLCKVLERSLCKLKKPYFPADSQGHFRTTTSSFRIDLPWAFILSVSVSILKALSESERRKPSVFKDSIFLNVSIPFNRVRTEKSWPRAREKVVKIVTKPDTKTNII